MSIVRELDLCPHCLEKIYREIARCQNQLKETQQDNQDKVAEGQEDGRQAEKDEKKRRCGKDGGGGGSRIATKEEVDKCLASLPYTIPICDYCKLHRNISILKLPPTSYLVQKPEDVKNQNKPEANSIKN